MNIYLNIFFYVCLYVNGEVEYVIEDAETRRLNKLFFVVLMSVRMFL
jgi:hypothetical protein